MKPRDRKTSYRGRRRSASGSPGRDHYRPREPDALLVDEQMARGWDRYVPNDNDNEDRNKKPSKDSDRDARNGQPTSVKPASSLPSRPGAPNNRPRSPTRRASSREPPSNREANKNRFLGTRAEPDLDNHWSPGHSRSPSPRPSTKRDIESRGPKDGRDHRISPQASIRPVASRRPTHGRSRSRSPRARSPDARSTRRPQSPPLSTLHHNACHHHTSPSSASIPRSFPVPEIYNALRVLLTMWRFETMQVA